MSKIEEIASKHLGKAGDGTVVKPYVTPDTVDSSLLVGIPRDLNRADYGITNKSFFGSDTWYAFEVSCLMQNGMPLNFILRIEYQWDSECIVESKSFKLYLNSFNLMRVSGTPDEVRETLTKRIKIDLQYVIKGEVKVELTMLGGAPRTLSGNFVISGSTILTTQPMTSVGQAQGSQLVNLENTLMNTQGFNILDTEFTDYTEAADLIKINPARGNEIIHSYSLRSNCRVTNQPDWGDIYIAYEANMSLDYVALMKYIVSMRKKNEFHEEICESVFVRVKAAFQKAGAELHDLVVLCNYSRRGGIDIRPIRHLREQSYLVSNLRQYITNGYKTEKQ